MSEKRFIFATNEKWFLFDNETEDYLDMEDCKDKLNEQQDTIITLKRRLEKINGGYGHLPHKNGLTPNEWVIKEQEKELKKKDEMISEFIERHSEDIVKISELQATIQSLEEENEQLEKENRELNSIKKFAEKNGINIFLIDEAFRKCWKDNGKLFEENEHLNKARDESDKFIVKKGLEIEFLEWCMK